MASPPTSQSLLERARDSRDGDSWRRLTDLYLPLIRRWVRPNVAQMADADDVTQDVLQMLVRELPRFQRDSRPGAFRAWLKALTLNRIRAHWHVRRPVSGRQAIEDRLQNLEDPH